VISAQSQRPSTVFDPLARLLLPEPHSEAVIIEADEEWHLDWRALSGAPAVVWGRPPTTCASGLARLARNAAHREHALQRLRHRSPRPLRIMHVHRWPPTVFQRSALSAWMSAAAAGALVELSSGTAHERPVDVAAAAAGGQPPVRDLSVGAGGSLLARIAAKDGGQLILRVGDAGHCANRGMAALEHLARLGLPNVPLPAGRGRVGYAAWSAERALPGRRPRRAGRRLLAHAVDLCLRLPRRLASPTALADDFQAIGARLPALRAQLAQRYTKLRAPVSSLPAVMRHGDLWAGNLLVERGLLSGVVDWDAWHPAAVPGTDLLHLLAMEEVVGRGRSLGEVWLERPWNRPAFRDVTARYWRQLGITLDQEILEAVGWGWWANQVAWGLARLPELANDEQWLDRNVHVVMNAFEA
jgi:hypothetical protein